MFHYCIYALKIQSALPLPELLSSEVERADVTIHLQHEARTTPQVDVNGTSFRLSRQEAHLFWSKIGGFQVRNGNEVIVSPVPGVEEQLVRLPLLGVVLAVLLHQRGHLVLHASAIVVNGRAVVFLGDKGQGKSTTAAACYARGHDLLADDVVALTYDDIDGPLVLPGAPQFKLWPEVVTACLGDDPDRLPRLASSLEKRARTASERFARQPVPLGGIYVLETGPSICIRRLHPQTALVQLLTHTYVARFGRQLLQETGAVAHMQQCARLINRVPMYTLERPRNLDLLPAVVQLVDRPQTNSSPQGL